MQNPPKKPKNPPKPQKPKKRRGAVVAAITAAVLAALLIDSNFRLSVSRFEITGRRVPKDFDGFKIVQLSDLHGAVFGKNNTALANKALELEPDIIILTGDFISKSQKSDLPAVRALLERLRVKDLPIFYITGNHDWASGETEALLELLEEYGVTCLHNQFLTLTKGNSRVILCGVEDPNSWSDLEKPDSVVRCMREQYPDDYVIFLGHRNYWMERYPNLDVDLILCGHSHGGIVRLPIIGGVFGTEKDPLFPEHEAGLYENSHYSMIVSRGLGQVPVIPRFLNNPEVVCVTLRSR